MILHPDTRPAPRCYTITGDDARVCVAQQVIEGPAVIGPLNPIVGDVHIRLGAPPACFQPREGVSVIAEGEAVALMRDLISGRRFLVGLDDPAAELYIPLYAVGRGMASGGIVANPERPVIFGDRAEMHVVGVPLAGMRLMPAAEPSIDIKILSLDVTEIGDAEPKTINAEERTRVLLAEVAGDATGNRRDVAHSNDEYFSGIAAMRLRRMFVEWIGVTDAEAHRYLLALIRGAPDALDRMREKSGA